LITKENPSSKYNHHTHLLLQRTKVASQFFGILNKNTRYIIFRKQTHQEMKVHEPVGRGEVEELKHVADPISIEQVVVDLASLT
jgi:hypothetical protein